MHESIVAISNLVEELAYTKRALESAERDAEYARKDAVDALKKEMAKVLNESDIKREVAIARLDAYEKMTSKDDFNKEIREMLKSAIAGLSVKPGQQQQKQQERQ